MLNIAIKAAAAIFGPASSHLLEWAGDPNLAKGETAAVFERRRQFLMAFDDAIILGGDRPADTASCMRSARLGLTSRRVTASPRCRAPRGNGILVEGCVPPTTMPQPSMSPRSHRVRPRPRGSESSPFRPKRGTSIRRLPSGPLRMVVGLLGSIAFVVGLVMIGAYMAGSSQRNDYDHAPLCSGSSATADCRQNVAASVESVVPESSVQRSAQSSRLVVTSWQVSLHMQQGERSVQLVSSAFGIAEGDTVTAEIWHGSVTQIVDNSSVYLTTDSPNAYGNALLVVGFALTSVGFLLDAAVGIFWIRRRTGRAVARRFE